MSTAVSLRSTPAGESTVPELVGPGDVVKTNYNSGPYRVIEVAGPFGHGCYSLILTKPEAKLNQAKYWINELVAVGGRLLKLYDGNDDEVFILSKGANDVSATATKKKLNKSDEVVAIPLDKLHDHPGNPDSTEAEIMEMVSWLQEAGVDEEGQDEPISVRPMAEPIGHYEVLAGKRRKAAATRLGWQTLRAVIRRDLDDDRDAASFAARNNVERRTESDLRKAHWLRYQVNELKMTVADAACAVGMAQSTASNLMAIADMCDKHTYWRDLLISGEMTAAHLRPLKKYRDYPDVMKLLQKKHAEEFKQRTRGPGWMEEYLQQWSTRDSIEYTIEGQIAFNTCALTFDDTIGDERAINEPLFDATKLTPAQRKKLKVVSIPAPGDKSDRMVQRCFNKKAWDVLQDAALNSKAKSSANASSKGATGSASANRERTPAEQKKLDKQRADQLKARIQYWRHAWLKKMVAERLDKFPLIVARMRAWLQTEPFSGIVAGELNLETITIRQAGGKPPGYSSSSATWKAIAKISADKIEKLSVELVRSILLHEDRDKKWPRLEFAHVDSLALMAKIDIDKEWSNLQRSSSKPVEFETFFLLHDKTQLTKLAKELKVDIDDSKPKPAIVKRLIGQAKKLPLPKSIAKIKPAKK